MSWNKTFLGHQQNGSRAPRPFSPFGGCQVPVPKDERLLQPPRGGGASARPQSLFGSPSPTGPLAPPPVHPPRGGADDRPQFPPFNPPPPEYQEVQKQDLIPFPPTPEPPSGPRGPEKWEMPVPGMPESRDRECKCNESPGAEGNEPEKPAEEEAPATADAPFRPPDSSTFVDSPVKPGGSNTDCVPPETAREPVKELKSSVVPGSRGPRVTARGGIVEVFSDTPGSVEITHRGDDYETTRTTINLVPRGGGYVGYYTPPSDGVVSVAGATDYRGSTYVNVDERRMAVSTPTSPPMTSGRLNVRSLGGGAVEVYSDTPGPVEIVYTRDDGTSTTYLVPVTRSGSGYIGIFQAPADGLVSLPGRSGTGSQAYANVDEQRQRDRAMSDVMERGWTSWFNGLTDAEKQQVIEELSAPGSHPGLWDRLKPPSPRVGGAGGGGGGGGGGSGGGGRPGGRPPTDDEIAEVMR